MRVGRALTSWRMRAASPTAAASKMSSSGRAARSAASASVLPSYIAARIADDSVIGRAAPAAGRSPRASRQRLAPAIVELASDDETEDLRGTAAGQQEARVAEVALDRVLHGQTVGREDARG